MGKRGYKRNYEERGVQAERGGSRGELRALVAAGGGKAMALGSCVWFCRRVFVGYGILSAGDREDSLLIWPLCLCTLVEIIN